MSVGIAVALFAGISYGLRCAGLLVPSDNHYVNRLSNPLTAAVLASLIITSSIADGTDLTIDARLVGLGVAGVAAARRLPLTITLVLAIGATALARLIS